MSQHDPWHRNIGVRCSKHELLSLAVQDKNPVAVRRLLERGADPNVHCQGDFVLERRSRLRRTWHPNSGLHRYGVGRRSCRKSTPDFAARITRDSGEWASFRQSPNAMHAAAANGRLDVLRALIGYGGDVNSRMEKEYTPLILAVLAMNYEAVELLIKQGADVNLCSAGGKSPLHHAVKTGKVKMVLLLINSGADVHSRTTQYVTALHLACKLDFQNIAEILIHSGADVDARTLAGVTPLHIAAATGNLEIAKMILNFGGDPRSITWKGKIDIAPMVFVNENDRWKIENLLAERASDRPRSSGGDGCVRKLVKRILKRLPWKKSGNESLVHR